MRFSERSETVAVQSYLKESELQGGERHRQACSGSVLGPFWAGSGRFQGRYLALHHTDSLQQVPRPPVNGPCPPLHAPCKLAVSASMSSLLIFSPT